MYSEELLLLGGHAVENVKTVIVLCDCWEGFWDAKERERRKEKKTRGEKRGVIPLHLS